MKKFDDFINLVSDQFTYGGKKYALDDKRESTDILFDTHGKNWLFGTLDKYCFRYSNLKRERDILKIATYCYIIWLKRGYFLQDKGVDSPIDTNIKFKTENFPKFVSIVWNYYEKYKEDLVNVKDRINLISKILQEWSKKEWIDVLEQHISQVFCLAFIEWFTYYSKVKEHDQDTWNEENNKENESNNS